MSEDKTQYRPPRIPVDTESAEWKTIAKALAARKAELLEQLAKPMLPERQSDTIRGALREVQALIDLDEKRKHIPSDIY
jgi:hypothetical protein